MHFDPKKYMKISGRPNQFFSAHLYTRMKTWELILSNPTKTFLPGSNLKNHPNSKWRQFSKWPP